MNEPNFLEIISQKHRLYNGRKLLVWEGKVKVKNIQGWVDNPRIELESKLLKNKLGDRSLSQEEVFDIMKNDPDVNLKELRDDIMKNGLRNPITLTFDARLLDGNRRFFAVKYALESLSPTDPNRQDLEILNAFVLSKESTQQDEDHVLVEENFSRSLKEEWPHFVKARRIVFDRDKGLSPEELAEKYNWTKVKIKETLRINELLQEFQSFATSAPDREDEFGGGLGLSESEAEISAANNYQFFNEAQKSFYNQLRSDYEFKVLFYKWVHEGKFSSFPEVRIAYKAWKDPETKSIIMSSAPAAAKEAKATLDYNTRVVKGAQEAAGRIGTFVKFLNGLSAEEMSEMPIETRASLRDALETVHKMCEATADQHEV